MYPAKKLANVIPTGAAQRGPRQGPLLQKRGEVEEPFVLKGKTKVGLTSARQDSFEKRDCGEV
jgi:hypothetical protein